MPPCFGVAAIAKQGVRSASAVSDSRSATLRLAQVCGTWLCIPVPFTSR
eukprot:CAMPEP_0198540424 /NCGR_PEP_ID=MMETSP1462-20131121/53162_1 /TAXON_ID=1333877 /ORGANISM="Brandtodinium nutriculum, Strain RCC3387" /LENGTH=48 /DNA_ID= /DNA_START= /DNA_END= /DNA_ORIENTATION=